MAHMDTTTVVVDSIGRASFKAQMIGKDLAEAGATNGSDEKICLYICICIFACVVVLVIAALFVWFKNSTNKSQEKMQKEIKKIQDQIEEMKKEPKDYYNIRKDQFLDFCYKVLTPRDSKDGREVKEFDAVIKKTCQTYINKEFVENHQPTQEPKPEK